MLLAPLRPDYDPTRAPVQTMIIIQVAKPLDRLAEARANISIYEFKRGRFDPTALNFSEF